MPKGDGCVSVGCEIPLPAGRRGKIIPTDQAGTFAVLAQTTWIDRLHAAGRLDDAERDAAATLHLSFEASGVRPLITGAYDGAVVDHGGGGGGLLDHLDQSEMIAWRRAGQLLNRVPARYRTQVSMVACWDSQPWDVPALVRGLRALAAALRGVRSCRT